MKCREFNDRLNDLLDERSEPAGDARLAGHARECASCRLLLEDQQVVLATLKEVRVPAMGSDFARCVVAKASAADVARRQVAPQRMLWAVGTLLSTAAAALLVVSLIWQARQGAWPFAGQSIAVTEDSHIPEQVDIAGPGRGAAPSGLALGQADWLIEAPRLPSHIRGRYRGTVDNLAVTLPETVQRLDEVEHYAPGIKPIRISLGVLLDTLWRTLPGGNHDERPTRTSYRGVELRHVV